MLDGLYKDRKDRFWDRVGRVVARTGVTPNQLTLLGVALCVANCGAYLAHRRAWILGLLLALFELLDDLDGAVARVTNTASRFGAYLDATTDRYKETMVLGVLGWVTGWWPLVFLCLGGSLITSYNKARAGMEVPVDNARWPDLFERFERVALLVAGLLLTEWVPAPWEGWPVLRLVLAVLAAGTLLSSLQRMLRARTLIAAYETSRASADSGGAEAGASSEPARASEDPST